MLVRRRYLLNTLYLFSYLEDFGGIKILNFKTNNGQTDNKTIFFRLFKFYTGIYVIMHA